MEDKELALSTLLKLTGGSTAADLIALQMPDGTVREFQFHSCLYSRNPYLMIVEPPVLDGVYLLAIREGEDHARFAGWEWAAKVRAQPYTNAGLDGSHGHSIARRFLRPMHELKHRILGPCDVEILRSA